MNVKLKIRGRKTHRLISQKILHDKDSNPRILSLPHPGFQNGKTTLNQPGGWKIQENRLLRSNFTAIFHYSVCALRGPAQGKTDVLWWPERFMVTPSPLH